MASQAFSAIFQAFMTGEQKACSNVVLSWALLFRLLDAFEHGRLYGLGMGVLGAVSLRVQVPK